jgi:hypothetical protein
MNPQDLSEARIVDAISRVTAYYRQERELYFKASELLSESWKTAVQSYFSSALLDHVRTVVLKGARIPPPPFYVEAVALSAGNFPDFVHLASVTYVDIVVFHDEIALRTLFHGLVHAAQVAHFGLDRYVELYVRGFARTRSWIAIPLEVQAYQLDSRFAMAPAAAFSVEAEIKTWADDGRY